MTTGVTVDFNANLARFTSGIDKATNDLAKFQTNAERIGSNISRAFGAVGAGLSVAGITAMIKGSIDAQDRLNDLRLTTGLAIETLSGLGFAASVSGGDLESVATSVNKLAVNMGKNADKFTTLGITAKDPLEAFKQLADIFVAVQDPQLRAALGAEALGKKWEGAAPLLSEGAAGITALVEKGKRLSGVTEASAKAADEFNDKWKELFGTGKFLNKVVGDALPLLNELADELLATGDNSKDLNSEFSPLLETGRAVTILFGNVAFVMKAVGTEIGGIAAQFAALGKGEFAKAWSIGTIMKEDAEVARKSFDDWEKKILGLGSRAAVAGATARKRRDAGLEARVSEFVDPTKEAKANKLVSSVEDYALRIRQAVAGSIGNSAIVKARELADQIEFLDSLFFDSGLDADIYTSALEKMTGMTDGASKAAERLAQMLEATPSAQLEKARDDMQLLAEAFERGTISEEQFSEAAQTRLGQLGEQVKEVDNFARDLGLTFSSAFEDAVIGGKKFSDVLQGLAQDIERIVLRKTITEPLGNAVADSIKGGGGLFGSIKSLFGFASGGSFTVGGAGGTDSQVVAFRATPGETVSVATPAQRGGGAITVNIIEDSSRAGQVTQRQSNSGGNMLDVFVDRIRAAVAGDIARGSGPIPQALGNTYGLNRAAGAY